MKTTHKVPKNSSNIIMAYVDLQQITALLTQDILLIEGVKLKPQWGRTITHYA